MSDEIHIYGDVGAAINAEPHSTVNLYLNEKNSVTPTEGYWQWDSKELHHELKRCKNKRREALTEWWFNRFSLIMLLGGVVSGSGVLWFLSNIHAHLQISDAAQTMWIFCAIAAVTISIGSIGLNRIRNRVRPSINHYGRHIQQIEVVLRDRA